jgi:DNA repair protein RadA/Sms
VSKIKSSFICQACGAVHGRWQGRCEACGEWNTISEETGAAAPPLPGGGRPTKGRQIKLEGLTGDTQDAPRLASGISELDRVTGGGFVKGSVILLGGEPGIGKSTLLVQAAAALATKGQRVVYISGEEAVAQVRLRAARLGLADSPVELASETHVDDIVATLTAGKTPALVIIDSIQTMWTSAVEAAPGTVTQVRGSAQTLIRLPKQRGPASFWLAMSPKTGKSQGLVLSSIWWMP